MGRHGRTHARSLVALALLAIAVVATSPAQAQPPERPSVSADVPVTANDLRAPRAQNSPLLAADPTDPRFVAASIRLDAPDFGCGLELSGDGGRSWVPANPVPKLPKGAEKCYSPEIGFDRDGTLYYLFVGLAGRGNNPMGVFLATSDDRGRSFSEPRLLLGPRNYMVRMAIDPTLGERGRIHLVWLATTQDAPLGGLPAPPNPVRAAFSDDGGESFSKPVQVNDPERQLSVAPAVAVGPDHAVHVLYYDLRDDRVDYQGLRGPTWPGRWSLVSSSSLDGGRRFRRGVVVDDRLKPPERVMLVYTMPPPALVADGSGGVFAAWHDARNGDWDVFLSRSTDRGGSWAPPTRLNDDRKGNGRHQYLPRLGAAPNGRVDAIFLDRRADGRNVSNETYYSFSNDRGGRFSPNVRLSSARSHSRSGQTYLVPSAKGKVEFGARLGLLSGRTRAVAAWTDTRNASAGAYQDVFSAEVALRPPAAATTGRPPGRASSRHGGEAPQLWLLAIVFLSIGGAALGSRWHGRPAFGGRG